MRRRDQKLATAFCRNHMINGEGGRIAEENRVEYVMDQAETTATVWLGVTLDLLPLPRSQVRPLHAARLLPAVRFLQPDARHGQRRQRPDAAGAGSRRPRSRSQSASALAAEVKRPSRTW